MLISNNSGEMFGGINKFVMVILLYLAFLGHHSWGFHYFNGTGSFMKLEEVMPGEQCTGSPDMGRDRSYLDSFRFVFRFERNNSIEFKDQIKQCNQQWLLCYRGQLDPFSTSDLVAERRFWVQNKLRNEVAARCEKARKQQRNPEEFWPWHGLLLRVDGGTVSVLLSISDRIYQFPAIRSFSIQLGTPENLWTQLVAEKSKRPLAEMNGTLDEKLLRNAAIAHMRRTSAKLEAYTGLWMMAMDFFPWHELSEKQINIWNWQWTNRKGGKPSCQLQAGFALPSEWSVDWPRKEDVPPKKPDPGTGPLKTKANWVFLSKGSLPQQALNNGSRFFFRFGFSSSPDINAANWTAMREQIQEEIEYEMHPHNNKVMLEKSLRDLNAANIAMLKQMAYGDFYYVELMSQEIQDYPEDNIPQYALLEHDWERTGDVFYSIVGQPHKKETLLKYPFKWFQDFKRVGNCLEKSRIIGKQQFHYNKDNAHLRPNMQPVHGLLKVGIDGGGKLDKGELEAFKALFNVQDDSEHVVKAKGRFLLPKERMFGPFAELNITAGFKLSKCPHYQLYFELNLCQRFYDCGSQFRIYSPQVKGKMQMEDETQQLQQNRYYYDHDSISFYLLWNTALTIKKYVEVPMGDFSHFELYKQWKEEEWTKLMKDEL